MLYQSLFLPRCQEFLPPFRAPWGVTSASLCSALADHLLAPAAFGSFLLKLLCCRVVLIAVACAVIFALAFTLTAWSPGISSRGLLNRGEPIRMLSG